LTQPVYHQPGEGVLSLGTGYYQGQSAVSFAFGYLDKEGQIGYSAGVGVPFGGSGPVAHAGVSIRLFWSKAVAAGEGSAKPSVNPPSPPRARVEGPRAPRGMRSFFLASGICHLSSGICLYPNGETPMTSGWRKMRRT